MTTSKELAGFFDYFQDLPDDRMPGKTLHPVPELLLLTLCGMICGAQGWEELEVFGESKLPFLRAYFPYEHGTPSDDTLRRFFRNLKPQAFEERFLRWVQCFQGSLGQIAIDGKALRHSFDTASGQDPLHLLSAFATETRLVLAQTQVDPASNEITALPALLSLLDLKGALVSMDAMGTQKDVAKQILAQGGDYLLALKENQRSLYEDVQEFFADPLCLKDASSSTATSVEKDHGRLETRVATVLQQPDWLLDRHPFPGIQSLIRMERTREGLGRNPKVQTETHYYVCSRRMDVETALSSVRAHWLIENSLHYVLDVSFSEDQARIRLGHAPRNMALVRKIVLNLIRLSKPEKQSLTGFRKKAGWNDSVLRHILQTKIS